MVCKLAWRGLLKHRACGQVVDGGLSASSGVAIPELGRASMLCPSLLSVSLHCTLPAQLTCMYMCFLISVKEA